MVPSKPKPEKKPQTRLPRQVGYTNQFLADWEDLVRSGKCNMPRLKAIMLKLIANDEPLDPANLEHELKGRWEGFHECHMGGDVLLIYDKQPHRIVFARVGSHAKLFNG